MAPIREFAALPAGVTERAIVMLMERLSAVEDQLLAAQREARRLEARQLIAGVTAFNLGRRALWGCVIPPGFHPSSGDYVALTDLGSDLVERALARRGGPLYEHINGGVYDRNGRMEPLASYLKLALRAEAEVLFVPDVDVGMIVVKIVVTPLVDVVEELHAILEEEDDDDVGPLRFVHKNIFFNRIGAAAAPIFADWIRGSVPPPAPGKIDDALSKYAIEHGIIFNTKEANEIWDTVHRYRIHANGSTKCVV